MVSVVFRQAYWSSITQAVGNSQEFVRVVCTSCLHLASKVHSHNLSNYEEIRGRKPDGTLNPA